MSEEEHFHTTRTESRPEVVPSSFATVHADKVMVGLDHNIGTATLTFLQMHIIPKLSAQGWGLDNVRWTIVGEIKVPIPAMNTLAVYYIHEMTGGLNIMPAIEKFVKENPDKVPKPNQRGMTYGPTDVRQDEKENA